MTNDSSKNGHKRANEHRPSQNNPQNEFPRQGNENPQIGLVGDAGMDKKRDAPAVEHDALEKEGEILGKDVEKRTRASKGTISNPPQSEE